VLACPLIIKIGICFMRSEERMRAIRSKPDIPGSIKSQITTSNGSSPSSIVVAVSASAHVVTSYAPRRNTVVISMQIAGSSSATRTRHFRCSTHAPFAGLSRLPLASSLALVNFESMTRKGSGILFPLFAVLLVAAISVPVVSVLVAVSPRDLAGAFSEATIRDAARISLAASFAATAVAMFLGVPAGYAISHAPGRLRSAALFVLALPLAFPPVASGLMLLSLLRSTAVPGSLLGVIAAEFFVSGSFVAIASAAAFAALDPIYADAARTLGASEWRIFLRIALPAAATNVTAGIAFAWLRAIGEYGATSILAYHPTSLPIALYITLSASGIRSALALCYGFVLLAAVVLAVQWVLRRGVVQ
jgi:ABC-type sulfate transport system permease component